MRKEVVCVLVLILLSSMLLLNVSSAGTTWTIQTVDTGGAVGDVGEWSDIALDSNGYPCISYFDWGNADLKFARWTGSAWSIQTVDSTGIVGEFETSLALDSSGNPHISYYVYDSWAGEGDLKYAKWDGSSWTIETVDSDGDVGTDSCIALDSSGNPHISYYDGTLEDLKYASRTRFGWATNVVDSVGRVGWFTSLALDSSGNPCISYWRKYTEGLKFARWTGSAWSIQAVDSAGEFGDPSLAIDSNGNPHISYYVSGGGDLKYASWTGSSWSFETVESVGSVGMYSSLALDSGGNAHISYHDSTNHSLKYASAQPSPPPLILENIKTWYWMGETVINSVVKGNVDGDGQMEIVTGGTYCDGAAHYHAQLCVWNGATMALENIKTWYWPWETYLDSLALGDVDGDSHVEIVTGGAYYDGTRDVAQLCVWDATTLALENVRTWYWTGSTYIKSVVVGDVDGDAQTEIVTGGYYNDGTRDVAQLCVWNGATLASENVKAWFWTSNTNIKSVAVANVDADGNMEIVTGGRYYDGTHDRAQLVVWNGASLAQENVKTWMWTGGTDIRSVAVGDVDGDGSVEIVTGGSYYENAGTAQLCVWNGATLALETVRTWQWISATAINSVAVGDVDGDAQMEIVTGGFYYDGARFITQLIVWDGATLGLEDIRTWYWTGNTVIGSVAVGDVDGDGQAEIVAGGYYHDGTRYVAQLTVWA